MSEQADKRPLTRREMRQQAMEQGLLKVETADEAAAITGSIPVQDEYAQQQAKTAEELAELSPEELEAQAREYEEVSNSVTIAEVDEDGNRRSRREIRRLHQAEVDRILAERREAEAATQVATGETVDADEPSVDAQAAGEEPESPETADTTEATEIDDADRGNVADQIEDEPEVAPVPAGAGEADEPTEPEEVPGSEESSSSAEVESEEDPFDTDMPPTQEFSLEELQEAEGGTEGDPFADLLDVADEPVEEPDAPAEKKGLFAGLFGRGKKNEEAVASEPAADASDDDSADTVSADADSADAASADTESADTESADTESSIAESTVAENADAESVETEPAESQPVALESTEPALSDGETEHDEPAEADETESPEEQHSAADGEEGDVLSEIAGESDQDQLEGDDEDAAEVPPEASPEPAGDPVEEPQGAKTVGEEPAPKKAGYTFPDIAPLDDPEPVFGADSSRRKSTKPEGFDSIIEGANQDEGGSTSSGTSALILPAMPDSQNNPLDSTGELYVSGQIHLPQSVGETGGHSDIYETLGLDVDDADDEHETGHSSGANQPVSARSAISAQRADNSMVAPQKADSSQAPVAFAIGGGTLVLLAAGAVYWGISTGFFG